MAFFKIILVLIASAAVLGTGVAAETTGSVITRVPEIRALSRPEAAKALPVRLTGVVVWQGEGFFTLYDGEASIFVDFYNAARLRHWKGAVPNRDEWRVGAKVEVEGVTDSGGFAPMVLISKLTHLGSGPLPLAQRFPVERLLSGAEDGQLVQVEGTVRKYLTNAPFSEEKPCMIVIVDGHECPVYLERSGDVTRQKIVDARVSVRGVLVPIANLRSQVAGMRVFVNGPQDIDVIEPPPTDPFLAPSVDLDRLMPFSPDAKLYHRRVTSGVVTFVVADRFFYMTDGKVSVRVDCADTRLARGDLVEVSGFIDTSRILASISDATVRVKGKATVPPPKPTTISEILDPHVRSKWEMVSDSDQSGRLVLLTGVLRRVLPPDKEGAATLVVESGEDLVRAYLPVLGMSGEDFETRWIEGSDVELTGACELEMAHRDSPPGAYIAGFHLWLSSPSDVRVIRTPPWWTPQRLALALGGMGLVLVLSLVWVLLLRRRVGQQMDVISGKLRSEAINTERNRLARDLHDTLEQQLVGVALQLDDAEEMIRDDPQAASDVVLLARRMLRHTRLEARRSVWDLRSQVLETGGLVAALEALVESVSSASGPALKLEVSGQKRTLPLDTEFQLFRITQEALANALKHAKARHVTINLDIAPETTCIEIADDGHGFSEESLERSNGPHFGVLGMQERAARIGAEIKISGTPGGGCSVVLTLSDENSQSTTP